MIARGGVLLRLTRHAEALEVADASLAEMPAEGAPTAKLREKAQRLAIDALMHTAIELDRAGRSDDAIEKIGQCYERIVQRDGSGAGGDDDEKMKGPLARTIMYNMGAMLLNAGKAAEAKGCFEQVLEADPEHEAASRGMVLALHNVGVSVLNEGNSEEAYEWFEHALAIDPAHGASRNAANLALYNVGIERLNAGDYQGAQIQFGEILERTPDHALAKQGLVTTLYNEGVALLNEQQRPAAALRRFARAHSIDPQHAEAAAAITIAEKELIRRGRSADEVDGDDELIQPDAEAEAEAEAELEREAEAELMPERDAEPEAEPAAKPVSKPAVDEDDTIDVDALKERVRGCGRDALVALLCDALDA